MSNYTLPHIHLHRKAKNSPLPLRLGSALPSRSPMGSRQKEAAHAL